MSARFTVNCTRDGWVVVDRIGARALTRHDTRAAARAAAHWFEDFACYTPAEQDAREAAS